MEIDLVLARVVFTAAATNRSGIESIELHHIVVLYKIFFMGSYSRSLLNANTVDYLFKVASVSFRYFGYV